MSNGRQRDTERTVKKVRRRDQRKKDGETGWKRLSKWVCATDEKTVPKLTDWLLIAIRIFPRQGRKKHDLKGKLSGGNEHISEFIKMATGEDCDRKKVSSHLQVLKKIMRDNRLCRSGGPKSQPR